MKRTSSAVAAIALLLMAVPTADARAAESRAARPRCGGVPATVVGTAQDDTLVGTSRADVIVAGDGNDSVTGKGGADLICAGAGSDTVVGGAGADDIRGGGGSDIVLGGSGNDRMSGGGGMDGLLGMGDADAYLGGGGVDIAAFLAASRGVTADLAAGTARGEGHDALVGIEALMGSSYADHLMGDGTAFNAFFSDAGPDVLDGRGGSDYVLFTGATGPVEVDLGDDRFTGNGLARGIENVVGSPYDDTIYGDSGFNYLDGGDGDDSVDGIDGSDLCLAETVVSCRDFHASGEAPADTGTDPRGVRPAGQARAARTPAQPPAGADRRGEVSTAWGFTSCPMLESQARIGTSLLGRGFFAARASLGFGGYTDWRYSPVVYLDASRYWWWYGGQWYGPYSKDGAGYYQFTQDIGATNTAYGWFYSYETQQYYSLGSCNGNGIIPGIFG